MSRNPLDPGLHDRLRLAEFLDEDPEEAGFQGTVAGDAAMQVERGDSRGLLTARTNCRSGHEGQDVVHEVRRSLSRTPGGAGGTEAAVLARESNKQLARAATAPDANEAAGKQPAGDELPERARDKRRHLMRREERQELRAHGFVEGRPPGWHRR